jgi:CBS domain-containing protein
MRRPTADIPVAASRISASAPAHAGAASPSGLIWIKDHTGTADIVQKNLEAVMKARDVMVSPVLTVNINASVQQVAKMLFQHRISAMPVVDGSGKLVGMVSEGDLLRRTELASELRRSWWLKMLMGDVTLASEYVKTHALKVKDVMTSKVITATPDTPLSDIAALLEKNSIKRVPILANGQLVGIVSRANFIQALASVRKGLEIPANDTRIREQLMARLKEQPWAHAQLLNATVSDGVVDLWGVAYSDSERKAIRVAAESIPGVRVVNDNLIRWPVETFA